MTFLVLSIALVAASVPQAPPAQSAATPAAAPKTEEPAPADRLPVSLDRIEKALSHSDPLELKASKNPVFRMEVFGTKPTIEDILGPDYLKGPTPAGPSMTHQEFLDMVTPKDVQGYAAFSNKEAFVVAATSLALQWALQKAIHRFETAKEERERDAARKEVQDALAELAKARKAAGLPPK